MPEQISVRRLGKVYPGGNAALTDVSFEVAAGTFLVLLGPSGSGKTTLLRTLAGIERASSGEISFSDRLVVGDRVHVAPDKRDLSMVFQDYALWPHLVARENVAFALRRRRLPREQRLAKADQMLERVGLGALAGRYPNQLSGGEQQRVALARALVADTGLILCDEPLSNLDADLRERMRLEISTLVREAGATTVYITHDQAEAFAIADRVGVLEGGQLVQLGTPEEVYQHPASCFVARFTGLAGELTVRALGTREGGHVTVEPVGMSCQRSIEARVGAPVLAGSSAQLLVRPTAVRLAGLDSGGCHLLGTVSDVAFRGRGYEHAIELPGGLRLAGVHAADRHERGSAVGLALDPEGCLVFPSAAGGVGAEELVAAGGTHPGGTYPGAANQSGTPGAKPAVMSNS